MSMPQTAADAYELEISPRGPFQLSTSLGFLGCFGPACWTQRDDVYRGAHVIRGRALLLELRQSRRALHLRALGRDVCTDDVRAAAALVRRVFSLEKDPRPFQRRVQRTDPVVAQLLQRLGGLRPVLFSTPLEALCWAVLGQRIRMSQATQLKARLTGVLGPVVHADGETHQAFPSARELLRLNDARYASQLGLPEIKQRRLMALAERDDRGDFDVTRLSQLPVADARAWLERSEGIGPWASEFTLIRAVGRLDVLPEQEQRFHAALEFYYRGARARLGKGELAEAWRGFESWAAFLLRVAYQQDCGN